MDSTRRCTATGLCWMRTCENEPTRGRARTHTNTSRKQFSPTRTEMLSSLSTKYRLFAMRLK